MRPLIESYGHASNLVRTREIGV
ncbi:hypothetical protein BBta_3913 [Bradyrhizobium sp. BTAi1]|nr:hypothetical protein BBta_3913 [Bradyrhizobium sp. BTAi1]